MENTHNMTVAEASELMGVSRQFVRVGLQQGILPFGCAVKISPNRWTYFISKKKFSDYLGEGGTTVETHRS